MRTLLVADDSVTIQRVIELTFADEDVRVVPASDGDQAIAVLERTPPDIVLADVGMPGRNGYEVAEYIKTTPGLAHIPVLLLTGAFEPIDQLRADEIGCDGILAKPFEPQLVIARVKELLNRSGRPVSPPEAVEAAAGSEQEAPLPRAESLADAFAALLAAERSLASPPRPVEPRLQSPVSDEVIEDVARRVISRMSDRVVRETVRQLALETTERLVREEIDRIKSSVR